ncbi:MAG: 50S ribosomal protein L25 [Actinobacteria bacterium]|nr:50S ribosomal protein L25 [Actinomycetota bacterium]
METVKLTVRPREEVGKGPNRRLRAAGSVPAVIYAKGQEAVSLSIDAAALKGAVGGGSNVVLELEYEGEKSRKKHFAVVKEFQRHPTRNVLLHLDLHEVDLKQEIEASVRVELVGIPAGAQEEGVLDHSLWEVTVRALPTAVPAHLELDVSALNIGDNLRVSDLTAPEGVTILDDPETTIVSVHPPRLEVVEEVEGEEGLEGEEGETAEGATASEGDAPAEEK